MHRVIVFSKDSCQWCDGIKMFLKRHQVEFLELNIEHNETAAEIAISQQFKTMPQVFADGKLIGGHDDTVSYYNTVRHHF